jgi:hypothetical protein
MIVDERGASFGENSAGKLAETAFRQVEIQESLTGLEIWLRKGACS